MDEDKAVIEHKGLVHQMAHRYSFACGPSIDYDDLVQQGFIGLIIACRKFDPSLGFKFSTYATQWIRQQIGRYVSEHRFSIQPTRGVVMDACKIRKAREYFRGIGNNDPSDEELAKWCSFTVARTKTALMGRLAQVYLGEDTERQQDFMERVLPKSIPDFEAMTNRQLASEFLSARSLTDQECEVLRRRFGFHKKGEQTQKEVGVDLAVTTQRIQQVESRGIAKLRKRASV